MPTLHWNNSRIFHKLLQIAGLAPFNLAPTLEESKLSKNLAVYNICLAILVLANVIYSETDPRNIGNYVNKTEVVDTAFDAVDWLGNFYVAGSCLLSIVRYKNTRAVIFGIRNLVAKCVKMGIVIDTQKTRNYFISKMIAATATTLIVFGLYIFFDQVDGTRYTATYWICVFTPMIIAVTVTMIFGSVSLILYQKLWIINEFLKRIMEVYTSRLNETTPKTVLLSYEKSLEALTNNFLKNKTVGRSKPFLIFVENYPKCFEKDYSNILKELNALREFYNEIIDVANVINNLFGPHLLFLFSWYFLGVVINLYAAVTFHVTGDINEEYGARVVLTSSYIFMVLYIISYTNVTSGEVRKRTRVA